MAPKVSDAAPVDPRLVGPLWRCLAVPGMEHAAGSDRLPCSAVRGSVVTC